MSQAGKYPDCEICEYKIFMEDVEWLEGHNSQDTIERNDSAELTQILHDWRRDEIEFGCICDASINSLSDRIMAANSLPCGENNKSSIKLPNELIVLTDAYLADKTDSIRVADDILRKWQMYYSR